MSGEVEHVASLVTGVHQGLEREVPHLEHGPYVICLSRAARAYAELSVQFDPAPAHPVVTEILARAGAEPSGALALYAFSVVIGPRLLVSLVDLGPLDARFEAVAEVTRRQLRACAGLASHPGSIDEPGFAVAARSLVRLAEQTGNAESFVLSR